MYRMNKTLLILAVFFATIVSCKKDLDLNKFNNINLNPEFGIPLAIVNLEINKQIKEDSNIVYDQSGLIKFTYRKDTIASFPVDSFVKIPKMDPITNYSKLGPISVDNTQTKSLTTLKDMAKNFDVTTKNALNDASGTVTIFPAISDNNNNVTGLPGGGNNYNSITIASGFLVLDFRNHLPVTIDVVRLNIFNMIPFQSIIGQMVFTNIAPGGSKKDSINLAGVTLSNSLGYSLPQFRSFASQSPVLVNLNDSIVINATTSNLKAASGYAVFPDTKVNPQTLSMGLKADDPTAQIKYVTINTGLIDYTLTSTISEKLALKLTLPGATKNGNPFAPISIEVNNETKKGVIDISGVKLDLTTDPTQPFNKLSVMVEPQIVSSGQLRLFDSSDYVNASFNFSTFQFEMVEGNLGKKSIPIDPSDVKVDMLKDFDSGFDLENPKLKILTNNSIGIPITVSLNVDGVNAKGATQNLNGPSFTIDFPQNQNEGNKSGNFEFNKQNSDIGKLISLPPTKVLFSGTAQPDTSGTYDRNKDFIKRGSGITVGFEMDMPFSLKTSDFTLSNKLKNPLFKFNADSTLGNFILKDNLDTSSLDYIELMLKIDNGIPFDGKLKILFKDKFDNAKDSVIVPDFIHSAIPDANGRTQTNSTVISSIKLDSKLIGKMISENLSFFDIKFQLSTYANGSQYVKMYSDYKAKIGLSAKLKLKNYNPVKK